MTEGECRYFSQKLGMDSWIVPLKDKSCALYELKFKNRKAFDLVIPYLEKIEQTRLFLEDMIANRDKISSVEYYSTLNEKSNFVFRQARLIKAELAKLADNYVEPGEIKGEISHFDGKLEYSESNYNITDDAMRRSERTLADYSSYDNDKEYYM